MRIYDAADTGPYTITYQKQELYSSQADRRVFESLEATEQ